MAWDPDELRAEIMSEFDSFGDWYVSEHGVSIRVCEPDRLPAPRKIGRPKRMLTAFGETKSVDQWAKLLGCDARSIFARLSLGWSVRDAVSRPVEKRVRVKRAVARVCASACQLTLGF